MSDVPLPPPPPPMGITPPPTPELATWGQRVLAYLIDGSVSMLGSVIMIMSTMSMVGSMSVNEATGEVTQPTLGPLYYIGLLVGLAGSVFFIWSYVIRQGKTGQSLGKSKVGIKVVSMTGQPLTAGNFVVRWLCHIIDGIPCYLGFLWPLWDAQKQTFTDKILSTVVVQAPKS